MTLLAERAGWQPGEIRTRLFRHTYCTARLQTLDPMDLNPFALEKMKPDDQERVRQEATQMGQPIRQESGIIQNPFVPSPK